MKSTFILAAIFGLGAIYYLTSWHIPGRIDQSHIAGCPAGYDETGERVRIAFYNTENFFDTVDDSTSGDEEFLPDGVMHWTYNRYKAKLEKTCKVIIAIGEWKPPDIIGLGEIENSHVLHDLIYNTPLLKYEYRYIHKNSPDNRGIDVALLYNPATIRLLENIFIPVRFFQQAEKNTRDILHCKVSVGQGET